MVCFVSFENACGNRIFHYNVTLIFQWKTVYSSISYLGQFSRESRILLIIIMLAYCIRSLTSCDVIDFSTFIQSTHCRIVLKAFQACLCDQNFIIYQIFNDQRGREYIDKLQRLLLSRVSYLINLKWSCKCGGDYRVALAIAVLTKQSKEWQFACHGSWCVISSVMFRR